MPFCPSCGNQVTPNDRFCGRCGAAQPSASTSAGSARTGQSPVNGLSDRNAASLCYIPFFGWVVGLFVLASEKFRSNKTVRFHAFQGLYLFVTWLVIDLVTSHVHNDFFFWHWGLRGTLKLAMIGTWIYMLIQTNQDRLIRLPFLSDLADRSVDEQK